MTEDAERLDARVPYDPDLSSGPMPSFADEFPPLPLSPSSALCLPTFHPGYARIESNDDSHMSDTLVQHHEEVPEYRDDYAPPAGLGIGGVDSTAPAHHEGRESLRSTQSLTPIVSPPTITPAQSTQTLSTPVFSPVSPEIHRALPAFETLDSTETAHLPGHKSSQVSSHSIHSRPQAQNFQENDALNFNVGLLGEKSSLGHSTKSAYEVGFDPRNECPAAINFHHSRLNWFGMSIFVLSIFSTVFSGIYFVIAAIGPRYGHTVGTGGRLSSSTASILVQLFAKLIELSYVTVIVAFVGQALSRRSFMSRAKGVSLAEWNMRMWIIQPGSMITNYESLQYAALTVLGVWCLTAALVGLLYTTAADALVSPQLKFSDWRDAVMQGPVLASFGNVHFIHSQCQTPLNYKSDNGDIGGSCAGIQYSGFSHHNFQKYLANWAAIANSGNGSADIKERPQGYGLLYENTTVLGSWIQVHDVADASASRLAGGRIVNNVTLAMPHPGVSLAAYDGKNNIQQPKDLDGLGVYSIRASVPSPAINVLCVNVNETDIEEIIYNTSSMGAEHPLDFSQWPDGADWSALNGGRIKTPVDEIFGWANETFKRPPVFYKMPGSLNTVINQTFNYGRDAIYLLGKSGPLQDEVMFLCSFKAVLTPFCSTNFTATSSGATMSANCEDENDGLAFIKSVENATAEASNSKDWPEVAADWALAVGLSIGAIDTNASIARVITELALTQPALNRALPSPAEALAALASSTLLLSSDYAPFVMYWNYSLTSLVTPQYQYFNATIRAQEYASGGVLPYQRGFFVVLFIVFISNILVFIYFAQHKGIVTDYSEPTNLFSLAINSPPSAHFAGSCGAGPERDQFAVKWRVMNERDHLYMTSEEPKGWKKKRVVSASSYELSPRSDASAPVSRTYSKFSRRTTLL